VICILDSQTAFSNSTLDSKQASGSPYLSPLLTFRGSERVDWIHTWVTLFNMMTLVVSISLWWIPNLPLLDITGSSWHCHMLLYTPQTGGRCQYYTRTFFRVLVSKKKIWFVVLQRKAAGGRPILHSLGRVSSFHTLLINSWRCLYRLFPLNLKN
jgi:hypothetical protein